MKEEELPGMAELLRDFEARLNSDEVNKKALEGVREALRDADLRSLSGEMAGGLLMMRGGDGCWACTHCITPCVSCVIKT